MNVVSHKRLKAAGYRLDDERNVIMQNNGDIFRMYEIYRQTVIHYRAVPPAAFTATTATTATTASIVTTATTAIMATTATKATKATAATTGPTANTSPLKELLTAITPVTIPPAAVSISSRKPLKHRLINGITWHLCCSHPSKKTFENIVKRTTKDKIDTLTTL